MGILPNHRHFTLGHKIFNVSVNRADCCIELDDFFLGDTSSFGHLLDLLIHFLLVCLGCVVTWMKSQSDLLFINSIFHIAEDEGILTR